MVLQGHRSAEHRHDPVAGELVHRAAVTPHHSGGAIHQCGHDLAKPLGPECRLLGVPSRTRDRTARSSAAHCHISGTLLWPSPDPPPIPARVQTSSKGSRLLLSSPVMTPSAANGLENRNVPQPPFRSMSSVMSLRPISSQR